MNYALNILQEKLLTNHNDQLTKKEENNMKNNELEKHAPVELSEILR